MSKRKIIQIVNDPENEYHASTMLALCDDGTIWYYYADEWLLFSSGVPSDDV